MKKILFALLIGVFLVSNCYAAAPTRTYTYTSGNTIDPDEVTTNENNIFTYLQNGVDTYVGGSITTTAIANSTITNSDISSTAAIALSKLASTPYANVDINRFSRDTTVVTGTQSVTGVGFTPVFVIFLALEATSDEVSWGFDDGTNKDCIGRDGATYFWNGQNHSISGRDNGTTDVYNGFISSLDSDGFTISWTKTGSPSGTLSITYLAVG